MTAAVSSNPSLYASTGNAYAAVSSTATTNAGTAQETAADQTYSAATDTVTLSDAAKAYLAAQPPDAATLAGDARKWFDQQYQTNGITSPMIDGQLAVDMTSQSRATLSAVAANTQSLFSHEETVAAALVLQNRFDAATMPHVVIARHTGDYASLYQAASDYLDQAGADERATPLWLSEKQAVTDGLALAKKSPQKAPDTGNGNDPVRALLDKTSQAASTGATTDPANISANARAMLDAQANKARDAGTELVFDPARKTGQQADFSKFDSQTLAVVSLNQDDNFSTVEARAAKKELSERNRADILAAFDSKTNGDLQSQSLALLSHYSNMSSAEKTAMGYTSELETRLIQNYRAASMFQSLASGSGSSQSTSILSYL